jgi:hypothetical protein
MKNANQPIGFSTIARQYKALVKKYPDLHLPFCVKQENLAKAIEAAAKAIDEKNKIHGHQRRIGKQKLNEFAEILKTKEKEIRNAKTFDELIKIIIKVELNGIGDLTKYDTTTRIGAYMNLFPENIYLHAGTKIGAKMLHINITGKDFITPSDLPKEFQTADFTPSEFEDILCIFKGAFEHLVK